MDQVILEKHCDVVLQESDAILSLAYLNSYFQTGLKNILDRAILLHSEAHVDIPRYAKVDEIPFDFQRRIMSVIVRTPEGQDRMITKGAPEEIFPRCQQFELDGDVFPMEHLYIDELKEEYQ
jgi:Mg2+-importing ATPase